ncbi:MAG: DUF3782 domain-containing protein [Desulfobacteraceae bacterium]|nr:DUF3782 domain-containing protein [Desulfobacteraceae bacterium]
MGLEVIINEFPPEMHIPIQHLVDWMQANQGVSKQDFSELKQSIQKLNQAQELTEYKVHEMAEAVRKLAEAQERTEQAQERTEQKLSKLAEAQERTEQAQERTEQRLNKLADAQERTEQRLNKLADAQQSMEQRMTDGFKSLSDQIAALGGRWGIYNEGTFRSTIYGLFKNMEGIKIEEGFYGGRQVDLIIRNGEHIILEITSRMHLKDIKKLYQSADDYRNKVGTEAKLMVATSYISPSLMQKIMGLERPIEIFSYDSDEQETDF